MVAAVNGPNNIPAIIATANETGISKAIIFFGEPYFVCVSDQEYGNIILSLAIA